LTAAVVTQLAAVVTQLAVVEGTATCFTPLYPKLQKPIILISIYKILII
jgi:hypothetical protein